jgi:hypothetical protein
MKIIAAALTCIMVVAPTFGLAGQANVSGKERTGPHSHRHLKSIGRGVRAPRTPVTASGGNGYQERLLEKVPFGSPVWWQIYEGEPLGK